MQLEDIINIFKSRYEIDRYDPENGLPFIILDRNIKVTVQNHHVLIEWKNLGIPSYIKTKKNKMLFGIGIQKAFVIQSGFYDSELLEIVEKCNLKATVIYDSVIKSMFGSLLFYKPDGTVCNVYHTDDGLFDFNHLSTWIKDLTKDEMISYLESIGFNH